MFSAPISICLALAAVALLLHRIGVWATFRHALGPNQDRALEPRDGALPGVTLLKPVKGLEEQLEQNLRSFFDQQYPGPVQIVFASTDAADPAMLLARRIALEFPERDVTFVLSDHGFGHNPKVANLAGALRVAKYDLLLQTDANVRIRPGYLQAVVREFIETDASILGSLIAGVGERSLGAVLDNIQLTAFTTPAVCIANEVAGVQCVIGKSMLFRRSELDALGGLAMVKDVLAEDFVLGQAYQNAGKKVVVSRMTVENVNIDASVHRFLSRHSRWLKMRVVIHVGGFVADLLSNATFFTFLAVLLSGFDPRVLAMYAAVVLYKGWLDTRLVKHLRGTPVALHHLACMPLRDLVLPAIWVYALFSRTTEWRGERFRLGQGSLLTPVTSELSERALGRDAAR